MQRQSSWTVSPLMRLQALTAELVIKLRECTRPRVRDGALR